MSIQEEEEEVGRTSISLAAECTSASLCLGAPSFLLLDWRPDSRGDTVGTLGQALEPCLVTNMGSA